MHTLTIPELESSLEQVQRSEERIEILVALAFKLVNYHPLKRMACP